MDIDFILIKKMMQGDEEAFDSFVHKYYEQILKYCCYHCFDKKYAEDLAQETFVHFFTKLSDYHYRGKTKNYLYTIAGNLCKDYYKKVKEIPTDKMELKGVGVEEHQMEAVVNKLTIEWALDQLPGELREIIILYYFQELKLKEIASTLHIGLPLVKYRVKQAKIQLEKLIRKEGLYGTGRTT